MGREGGSWETHSFPTASSCVQVQPIQVSTSCQQGSVISEDKDYSLVLTHAMGKRERDVPVPCGGRSPLGPEEAPLAAAGWRLLQPLGTRGLSKPDLGRKPGCFLLLFLKLSD